MFHYLLANVISISIGITNNFIWNAKYNFKATDQLLKRYIKFYSVGLFGMAISSTILTILVSGFNANVLASKAATIFVVFIVQFTLNRKYAFGAVKV